MSIASGFPIEDLRGNHLHPKEDGIFNPSGIVHTGRADLLYIEL
jgi:hypothetical protein